MKITVTLPENVSETWTKDGYSVFVEPVVVEPDEYPVVFVHQDVMKYLLEQLGYSRTA